MKLLHYLSLAASLIIGLNGCSPQDNPKNQPQDKPTQPDTPTPSQPGSPDPEPTPKPSTERTLIVYYSFTNNIHSIVQDLDLQIDADVIRIEPAEKGLDYAANNYAIGSKQIQDIRNNPDEQSSYPTIDKVQIELEQYDTIIIATPLWWSSMAAPMQTFLFDYGAEMKDKNIGLIVSSASSGISGVESDAKRLIPQGNFLSPSLWIRSSQTALCHGLISEWLSEINL